MMAKLKFSVSLSCRNRFNMLISCWRNISYYDQCWKQLCCLIFPLQELELRRTLWERLQRDHALNHVCNQTNLWERRHRRGEVETRKHKSTCGGTGVSFLSFSKRSVYALKCKFSLLGAETASSTQSTAQLVQLWSSYRPISPQV